MTALRTAAEQAKAWPFEEARKLLKRLGGKDPVKGHVLFETGYGPSGLPHIGTFGEVARTTMIRRAFETLCDIPTRLLCFSDDMDGMRKAPDNVPNRDALLAHMQKPLTAVPDPFGEFPSFGDHNNAMLRRFLDTFGFDYEFASATDYYKAGRLDDILLRAAEKYDEIMAVMLASLREERQQTYSCFLPISPTSGRVLYVPIRHVDAKRGEISFDDEDGTATTLPLTGGQVKLQWKPDFGARWAALDVDFEMYGKDHLPNTPIYDRICEILGGRAPQHMIYELFLDEEGRKISKSKGNGVSIDEWLRYAPSESLSLFMFQKPKTAKRLHWDVIPRAVDEYDQHLRAFPEQEPAQKLENPVWHIHRGQPPASEMAVPFAMLLNLAAAAGATDKAVVWGFIQKYAPEASPQTHPTLDAAVGRALVYVAHKILPNRRFRLATPLEAQALAALAAALRAHQGPRDAATLQDVVYAVGNVHPFAVLRDWFVALYAVLLGAEQGPRFGGFIALYGVEETVDLIDAALAGELVSPPA